MAPPVGQKEDETVGGIKASQVGLFCSKKSLATVVPEHCWKGTMSLGQIEVPLQRQTVGSGGIGHLLGIGGPGLGGKSETDASEERKEEVFHGPDITIKG